MQGKEMRVGVPTFSELFAALPPEYRTDPVHRALREAYRRELEQLLSTAGSPACRKPQVTMSLWRTAGAQRIAEFSVSDAEIPRTAQVNWHGQNTSQWLYAGAIVVQDGIVSTHH